MDCINCRTPMKGRSKYCSDDCYIKYNTNIVQNATIETPCHEWTGYIEPGGYGRWQRDKPRLAHRVVMEITQGPPSSEKPQVNHLCHNRKCVNPGHLYYGTHNENSRDMVDSGRSLKGRSNTKLKGRPTKFKGSRNRNARLTESDIPVIRSLILSGKTHKEIGEMYAVSSTCIGYISTNKTWRHV